VAAIVMGLQKKLYLGNLDARRDWGHARDFVEGMWRILQQETPDDYVLATGEMHSVRELVEIAFEMTGRRIEWRGKGIEERGVDAITGTELVGIDPKYFRPTEVDLLLGDPTKARERLDWRHKITFREMVAEMVREDLKRVARDQDRKDIHG
jgi:GDPmannose 4,6-dehydratase